MINSNFNIWQRNLTQTLSTPTETYICDRWISGAGDGTTTVSRVAFGVGEKLPVTEIIGDPSPKFFYRHNQTLGATSTNPIMAQRIESVRKGDDLDVTLTFYLRLTAGSTTVTPQVTQNFGTGGSPSAPVTVVGTVINPTGAFVQYTQTFTLPSISGKTLGTNGDDYLELRFLLSTGTTFTLDVAQAQLENGQQFTEYEVVDPAVEIVQCQRYYEKSYNIDVVPGTVTVSGAVNDNVTLVAGLNVPTTYMQFNVPKRATPTVTGISTSGVSGQWLLTTSVATAIPTSIGTSGYSMTTTLTGIGTFIWFGHWTADSEL